MNAQRGYGKITAERGYRILIKQIRQSNGLDVCCPMCLQHMKFQEFYDEHSFVKHQLRNKVCCPFCSGRKRWNYGEKRTHETVLHQLNCMALFIQDHCYLPNPEPARVDTADLKLAPTNGLPASSSMEAPTKKDSVLRKILLSPPIYPDSSTTGTSVCVDISTEGASPVRSEDVSMTATAQPTTPVPTTIPEISSPPPDGKVGDRNLEESSCPANERCNARFKFIANAFNDLSSSQDTLRQKFEELERQHLVLLAKYLELERKSI